MKSGPDSPWGYPNTSHPDQHCPAPRVPSAEVCPDIVELLIGGWDGMQHLICSFSPSSVNVIVLY